MVRERGRVVAHVDSITLRNALFVVQRAGYERTVRDGQKRSRLGEGRNCPFARKDNMSHNARHL